MKQNDFNNLFDEWASSYDQTVYDTNGEYQEVFEGYDRILDEVVSHVPERSKIVMEIGVGTGNVTERLLAKGYQVIGVEPSAGMREEVRKKSLSFDLRDGHFLDLPLQPEEKVDAIVSSFAFHHLTLTEKAEAFRLMSQVLTEQGAIIFADTSYKNEQSKREIVDRVRTQKRWNLLRDLESEFYEQIEDLEAICRRVNFSVEWKQLNRFVWLLVAMKK